MRVRGKNTYYIYANDLVLILTSSLTTDERRQRNYISSLGPRVDHCNQHYDTKITMTCLLFRRAIDKFFLEEF